MNSPARPRQTWAPIHSTRLRYLLIVPVLLAVATAVLLFLRSDVNIAFLWSQCHSRSRIQWLSRIPLVGTFSCVMVSFFAEALASARSFAVMGVVLSLIAGLLTVNTVESARAVNSPALLIAYPTGAWLVFNLLGGAVVWELVIVPAFFRRARQVILARHSATPVATDGSVEAGSTALDPDMGADMRHLQSTAEVVAIPAGVALGCVLPSVLMMVFDEPVSIIVWLFFPMYVSVIRQAVRWIVLRVRKESASAFHLESNWTSLVLVYAVPVICSALSHGLLLFNLILKADDRKEMTRSTLRFIEIDIFFIGLTVLYWVFVEAGWRVVAVMAVSSMVLGPGAGVCLGWIYREAAVSGSSVKVVAVGAQPHPGDSSEETPLLR